MNNIKVAHCYKLSIYLFFRGKLLNVELPYLKYFLNYIFFLNLLSNIERTSSSVVSIEHAKVSDCF